MAAPTRTLLAYAPATLATGTTTGPTLVIPEMFTSFIARLSCGTVTGTTPTLDVYIQQGIRDAASADTAGLDVSGTAANYIWDDYAHFAQVTSSNTVRFIRSVGGGNVESAAKDATLAAATIENGPIGAIWRVKVVVAGTNPSFAAVKVLTQFIP
jgi:hypothetical protein